MFSCDTKTNFAPLGCGVFFDVAFDIMTHE